MTDQTKSNQNGAQNGEMTALHRALLSTNAASTRSPKSPPTSDISGISVQKSQTSLQPTDNFQDAPNAARLIHALASKLGTLVEWRFLTLKDGRQGWALFFSATKWEKDLKTKALVLR